VGEYHVYVGSASATSALMVRYAFPNRLTVRIIFVNPRNLSEEFQLHFGESVAQPKMKTDYLASAQEVVENGG
jgi:hypothetical protein